MLIVTDGLHETAVAATAGLTTVLGEALRTAWPGGIVCKVESE